MAVPGNKRFYQITRFHGNLIGRPIRKYSCQSLKQNTIILSMKPFIQYNQFILNKIQKTCFSQQKPNTNTIIEHLHIKPKLILTNKRRIKSTSTHPSFLLFPSPWNPQMSHHRKTPLPGLRLSMDSKMSKVLRAGHGFRRIPWKLSFIQPAGRTGWWTDNKNTLLETNPYPIPVQYFGVDDFPFPRWDMWSFPARYCFCTHLLWYSLMIFVWTKNS